MTAIRVVVVAHNNRSDLAVLAGWRSWSTQHAISVVVVDSGSTDGTAEQVARTHPEVELIRTDNRGFGAAANLGARSAPGAHIALLNLDATPARGWLDPLVLALESSPRVGLVGAQTPFPDERPPTSSGETFVSTLPGAALLIRGEAFAELGGFDEQLFLYWEDTDLCWRAQLQGWGVVRSDASVVVHRRGGSTERPGRWLREQAANGVYVIGSLQPTVPALLLLAVHAGHVLARGLRHRQASAPLALLRPPTGLRGVLERRAAFRTARRTHGRSLARLAARHRVDRDLQTLRRALRNRRTWWASR